MAGSTVVLFVVILAFLVGRVRAGADPGLARSSATPATQSAPPAASGSDPQAPGVDPNDPGQSVDPNDPFGQQTGPNADPGTSGGTDNFGNAVPDGQSPGSQSVDPPSTHVS